MYQLNDRMWPVVIFEFKGVQTLPEHEQSLTEWNEQFARNKPFVAVRVFHDDDSLVHADGTAQLTKAWLRKGAAQSIKTSVVAMINIVPESAYEKMKHMSVEAVFGVPGGIFKTCPDAAEWFNANIGSAVNIYLDPDKLG